MINGRSFLMAALLFSAASVARAATCTWTGGAADTNWSTTGNWVCLPFVVGHTHPLGGDSAVFPPGAPLASLNNNNDLSGLGLHDLQLNGADYQITGNAISLLSGITSNITGSGGARPVFSPDITVTNAQTFQCSGSQNFELAGTVNLNGNALTLDTTCAIFLSGNITGAGGITKSGTGFVNLSGPASDYTGATAINAGALVAGSNAALGAAGSGNDTMVASGASLRLAGGTAIAESLQIAGNGTSGEGALLGVGGDIQVNADVALTESATIGVTQGVVSIGGVITDGSAGFTLSKAGAGTLQLLNTNTYTGSTTVNAGTLEVDGTINGSCGVNSPGTLAGTGVIGNTISFDSGTIAPGMRTGASPGTLDGPGLGWTAGGTMAFQLGQPTLSDKIVLAGGFGKFGSGSYAFQFSDASTPPVAGVTYVLISFPFTSFSAGDFSFVYTGTGPSSNMTGTFGLSSTQLTFTPSSVASDLIFRDSFEK